MIVLLPDVSVARAIAPIEVLLQEGFDRLSLPIEGDLKPADLRNFFGDRVTIGVHDLATDEDIRSAISQQPAWVLARFVDVSPLRDAGITSYLSAMTPGEALAASRLADGVVIEPIWGQDSDLPALVRNVVGPDVPVLARGISDVYGVKPWLRAGADVCVTSPIGDAFQGGDLAAFRQRLRSYQTVARDS